MSTAKAGWLCLMGEMILWAAPALVGSEAGSGPVSVHPAVAGHLSCELLMYEVPNQYVVGKPVTLTVRFINHAKAVATISDSPDHYPFCSFDITGPTGKRLALRKNLDDSPPKTTPERRTIGPGRIHEARIDIADWYDLSQPGRYWIRAKWQVSPERATGVMASNIVALAVIPTEQAKVAELIRRATLPTRNGASEREAQCKLVEVGEPAVPAIVEWLELVESKGGPDWNSFADMVKVLTLIGSPRAREFLTPDHAHGARLGSEPYRAMLLKRVEIWQSEDRFAGLIEALDETRFNLKWAIFKLGVLGDARAIGPLDRIAAEDKEMDIRETAKDALAHLRDPNVPMRYICHLRSEEFVLTAAESYRVGEPVKVRCKITGGPYGSRNLVEFSKPNWHFLPWGFAGPDSNWSPPFGLTVVRRRDRTYDNVHPVRQLRWRDERIADGHPERYEGYVDVAELGRDGTFTLKPGASRVYEYADLRQAFKMTEPGEYRICVSSSNYVLSDFLTINILPAANGSAGPP